MQNANCCWWRRVLLLSVWWCCCWLLIVATSSLVDIRGVESSSSPPPCGGRSASSNCYYRISKPGEIDFLMVKNILRNLMQHHWNVTLDMLGVYLDGATFACDQYLDAVAVSQAKTRDYRHPHALFKHLPVERINQSVRVQYEMEWFDKFKMIRYDLQAPRHLEQCNAIGLKLFFLMHDYEREQARIFKCSSRLHSEEHVSALVDYYISRTFLKSCYGNLELIAHSIHRLLKFDCERAVKLKVAYYNSKYMNMFRTCDPELNVNDLLESGRFNNCSSTPTGSTAGGSSSLRTHIASQRKMCAWFDIVCKHPFACVRSMNWTDQF